MSTVRKSRSDKGIPSSHGYSITHPKLYNVYLLMRRRCEKPSDQAYPNYGGRGINVCQEWQSPDMFCGWAVANGYSPELTLERIDNSKGYSPANCVWVTRKAQARNRRSNRTITLDGRTQSIAAWAEEYGIRGGTLAARIQAAERAGRPLDPDRLLSKRLEPEPTKICLNGIERTLTEWAAHAGIHYTTICHRLREGWSIEAALTQRNSIGWRARQG